MNEKEKVFYLYDDLCRPPEAKLYEMLFIEIYDTITIFAGALKNSLLVKKIKGNSKDF